MFTTSEFIQQMHFHLPLFAWNLFHTSQWPPSKSKSFFENLTFHHLFLMQYFKMISSV